MRRDGTIREPRPLPPGMTPRLLSREEAAAYCGVSPNLFEERVGIKPVRCFGARRLWDRVALDLWLDRVSGLSPTPGAKPSIAERLG
jgi:hypothetical protein